MSQPDPYVNKLLSTKYPCAGKSVVRGSLNCILDARAPARGLQLSPFPSRAVPTQEIHELILTSEMGAGPGQQVDNIAYIAYFEITQGGVLWTGDRVVIDGREIGQLAGYDMTHFPNHMNIIVKTDVELFTGLEAGYQPGTPIEFIFPGRPQE